MYHLLIEAVLIVIIICILTILDAHRYTVYISMIVSLFFLLASIQLIIAFFRQLQYNPYSYNTVFYFGFALFLFVVFLIGRFTTIPLLSTLIELIERPFAALIDLISTPFYLLLQFMGLL